MNGFKRLAIELGVIGIVIGLALWFAHKRGVSTIPPNTDATISIDGNTVTIEKNNERTMKYAPKGTKIVVNKDGSLRVVSRQYGFCREYGGGTMVTNSRIMLQADVKLAYYMRFGLHANLGLDVANALHPGKNIGQIVYPALSLSYNLPFQAFSNTSVFIGHSLSSDQWVTGLRVRF